MESKVQIPWRLANPAKYAAYREKYRDRAVISRRRFWLKQYGLTLEDFNALAIKQRGLCACCGKPPIGKGTNGVLHVDHSHTTGKVRGLLCSGCNVAAGCLEDNAIRADKLAAYLRERGK